MRLVEWTSRYVEHVNLFKKNLARKNIKGNKIECCYKDNSKVIYFVKPLLDKEVLEFDNSERIIIICLNTRKNLEFLIDNWSRFINNQNLKFMFVNIEKNKFWAIIPYLHNKFCDKKSLKLGLISLFNSLT